MAKIYFSYNHRDADSTRELVEYLRNAGHTILIDESELTPGTNWRDTLNRALRSADVFVVVISENSLGSSHVMSEIGMARAYVAEYGRALFVPVLLDEVAIPPSIQDVMALRADRGRMHEAAERLRQVITYFEGKLAADSQKSEELAAKIQENSADYIKSASDKQKSLEKEHKAAGWFWYISGFCSLVVAVIFSLFILLQEHSAIFPITELIIRALGSALVVALLGACAKYCFSLGKSFTTESLKNSDRLHAMAFGEFYLRASGDRFDWAEIKDAFQHWNIDRNSTFSSLSPSDFDPRVIEILADIVKTAIGKAKGE